MEGRFAPPPRASPFGEPHHVGQAEREGSAVQAVLAHEVRPHAGQVALVGAGEPLVEQGGDGSLEDGVAEEFEALVVVRAEAAVRERAGQQAGLGEAVAEPLLEGVESGIHGTGWVGQPVTSSCPRT